MGEGGVGAKQLFVQSHSVSLSTKNRVLFFAENCNSKFAIMPEGEGG